MTALLNVTYMSKLQFRWVGLYNFSMKVLAAFPDVNRAFREICSLVFNSSHSRDMLTSHSLFSDFRLLDFCQHCEPKKLPAVYVIIK